MEHTKAARTAGWAAVGCAVLLTVLRVTILKTAFDENGLLPVGSKAMIGTAAAMACCFAVLCLLSLRLNRLPGTEACFTRRPVFLGCRLIAAILVFFGALTVLLDGGDASEQTWRLAAFSGIAAALAMLWTTLTAQGGKALFWLRLIAALYTAASLILRFRSWSHDPMTIHIAPLLLAWTCAMVEMMLLTGFPLKAGHRRSAVLFGLATGVFACMSIPDYLFGLHSGLPELLTLLGLALWCAVAAVELLRRPVQEEAPPASPAAPAEPEKTNAES